MTPVFYWQQSSNDAYQCAEASAYIFTTQTCIHCLIYIHCHYHISLRLNHSHLCHSQNNIANMTAVTLTTVIRSIVMRTEGSSFSNRQSSRFLSFLISLSFRFISSSICSKGISSSLRTTGTGTAPWKALSVYFASRPSRKEISC